MKLPLIIMYGSATGNSEHIAKNIAEKADFFLSSSSSTSTPLFYDAVIICSLDEYKKKATKYWDDDTSPHKFPVIIVCSTTGNGDSPENASRFTRYLKRKTTAATLPFRNVSFAVLGLGDTNYDQVCAMGNLIDIKLETCGGVRVKDAGMADEATGLEDVVEPWCEEVFNNFGKSFGLEQNIVEVKVKASRANSVFANDTMNRILNPSSAQKPPPPTQTKKIVNVLYGGELAEDIARKIKSSVLASASCNSKVSINLLSMKDFKKLDIPNSTDRCIFVVQTVENNQPSEDAGNCYRFFKRKSHESDALCKLSFAMVGLGNSNLLMDRQTTTAAECNLCAQNMTKRLEELGARMFFDYFETDERTDLVGVNEWIGRLCEEGLNAGGDVGGDGAIPPPPPPLIQTAKLSHKQKMAQLQGKGLDHLLALTSTSTSLPIVKNSDLPTIQPSSSSCQLVNKLNAKTNDASMDLINLSITESFDGGEGTNTNTITSSDSASCYSAANPYGAPIRSAAYLTNSPLGPARAAAKIILEGGGAWEAVACINDGFPLRATTGCSGQQAEDNGKRVVELELKLPEVSE